MSSVDDIVRWQAGRPSDLRDLMGSLHVLVRLMEESAAKDCIAVHCERSRA